MLSFQWNKILKYHSRLEITEGALASKDNFEKNCLAFTIVEHRNGMIEIALSKKQEPE